MGPHKEGPNYKPPAIGVPNTTKSDAQKPAQIKPLPTQRPLPLRVVRAKNDRAERDAIRKPDWNDSVKPKVFSIFDQPPPSLSNSTVSLEDATRLGEEKSEVSASDSKTPAPTSPTTPSKLLPPFSPTEDAATPTFSGEKKLAEKIGDCHFDGNHNFAHASCVAPIRTLMEGGGEGEGMEDVQETKTFSSDNRTSSAAVYVGKHNAISHLNPLTTPNRPPSFPSYHLSLLF